MDEKVFLLPKLYYVLLLFYSSRNNLAFLLILKFQRKKFSGDIFAISSNFPFFSHLQAKN